MASSKSLVNECSSVWGSFSIQTTESPTVFPRHDFCNAVCPKTTFLPGGQRGSLEQTKNFSRGEILCVMIPIVPWWWCYRAGADRWEGDVPRMQRNKKKQGRDPGLQVWPMECQEEGDERWPCVNSDNEEVDLLKDFTGEISHSSCILLLPSCYYRSMWSRAVSGYIYISQQCIIVVVQWAI